MSEQAILPYPEPDGTFTGGHAGTDTSRERAIKERDTGTLAARQKFVLSRLDSLASEGETVKEFRERVRWHHGQASSTLSHLHKAGKVACLAETRDRCHVYVLPEYVNGRETRPPGQIRSRKVDPGFEAYCAGFERATGIAPGPIQRARLAFSYNEWKEQQ